MSFTSIQFAIFFPVAVLVYFKIPYRLRNLWLLILSYYYYMCWRPEYALLMLSSTAITYTGGLITGKIDECGAKIIYKNIAAAAVIILNLLLLGYFKYAGLITDTINDILSTDATYTPLRAPDVLLPVGISFYIFQALSYTMDVYRKEIMPQKNFLKYALFVSFFPQLVAGPIERSKNLLKQFDEKHDFDYDRVIEGLVRMLWGFFMKLVIAVRLSVIADRIYKYSDDCTGYQLLLGTVCFAFQIYCDFASYSEIAIGAARVLGFDLMENFRQPFFAASCKELWNRWHISLNTWFRDYLYFPLGGSKKGSVRKYINLLIVFLVSGLWHGAAWTYVLWGFLSGLFQVIGDFLKTPRQKIWKYLFQTSAKTEKLKKTLNILGTFLLFCMSLVFFRSESLSQAFDITVKIFTGFGFASIFTTSPFSLGLGVFHLAVLIAALFILLYVDFKKEHGYTAAMLSKETAAVRWGLYFLMVTMILLSANFGADEFIYFQF